jgi:hypothetical protein
VSDAGDAPDLFDDACEHECYCSAGVPRLARGRPPQSAK